MKLFFYYSQIICGIIPFLGIAQKDLPTGPKYLGFDFFIGTLGDSNRDFPNHSLQKTFFLNIGKYSSGGGKEWEHYLNNPKTGFSLGFSDLGNKHALGYVYSILPYAEFSLFPSKTDRLHLLVSFGGSFMDKKFSLATNPNNKGISTQLNWTYKSSFYYNFLRKKNILWRIGLGYLHHSNGHIKKPNRGYNSFLIGVSAEINTTATVQMKPNIKHRTRSVQWFYTGTLGVGQNSLSDVFNSKKEVYTVAFSGGKIINKTFKIGGGLYYHFYEHYYDYIVNGETLVKTQEPHFKNRPIINASSWGVFGSAELLLGHVGMEMNVGINFFKPFYKIDWQLNKGYTNFPNGIETIVAGKLNSYYKIKHRIFSRMGLKYYLFDTNRAVKHNVFVGGFINANLGQADFSEFTIGYVHRFNL